MVHPTLKLQLLSIHKKKKKQQHTNIKHLPGRPKLHIWEVFWESLNYMFRETTDILPKVLIAVTCHSEHLQPQ